MMRQGVLSKESRVLLSTAGGVEADEAIATGIDATFNWDAFSDMASREHATSPIWRRIRKLPAVGIVQEASTHLQRVAMVSDFRMVHLHRRLDELAGALYDARIDVVLLKGAAVARRLGLRPEDRPMGDLDILVPPEKAAATRNIALGLGWTSGPFDDRVEFYQTHHHLPPMIDSTEPASVLEIHTDLMIPGHPFGGLTAAVRSRAEPAGAGPAGARVPVTIDLLLHTAIHFTWSHMFRLGAWRAFRDLNLLMTSDVIDWPTFVQQARATRAATACYWWLRLARTASMIPVPEAALGALRPPLPEFALQRLEGHYLRQLAPEGSFRPSVRLVRLLWKIGIQPGSSGHGEVRPWHNEEMFDAAGPIGQRSDVRRNPRGTWLHHGRYLLEIATGWRKWGIT